VRPLPIVLCCLLLLAGCAPPTVVKEVLAPAQAGDVARLTRLRVLPFDNDSGGQARAAVEQALASVTVSGRPYFAIVTPDAPAAPQGTPMQWSAPGKAKAQPIRYGSEGAVQGVVNSNSWRDEPYQETRRECLAEDNRGRCLAWGNRPVRCVRRTATFSFTPRVAARDSGVVLFSQEFSESGASRACLDAGAPESGQSLLARARDKAVARFRNQVAPHVVRVAIPLLLEDASMDSRIRTLAAGGAEYAAAGQTDKACRIWRRAAAEHAAGYALPYLCGVCAELEDHLDEAEGLYDQAGRRSRAPVPEIAAALQRVREARTSLERLESQMK